MYGMNHCLGEANGKGHECGSGHLVSVFIGSSALTPTLTAFSDSHSRGMNAPLSGRL